MSFLKFWGKKDKAGDEDQRKDEPIDPEVEKRRLRHSLSISRSGRFKQKKRERGQILDKPDLFSGQDVKSHREVADDTASNSSLSSLGRPSHSSPHPRSPRNTCRDINSKMATENMRMGPSVVI